MDPSIQQVTLQQLDKELHTSSLGVNLYFMETKQLVSDLTSHQLQEMQSFLDDFEELFAIPSQLHPSRIHDHHIPLSSDAKPPNIKPYHYGPLQKNEIEKVMQELLDA